MTAATMDDEHDPFAADLLALPEAQRDEFELLRGLAAMCQILVRPAAAGGFAVYRYGVPTHCTDLADLARQLTAFRVPVMSREELRRRAGIAFSGVEQALKDATTPDTDH